MNNVTETNIFSMQIYFGDGMTDRAIKQTQVTILSSGCTMDKPKVKKVNGVVDTLSFIEFYPFATHVCVFQVGARM